MTALAVSDRKAAAMLDMTRTEFLDLVNKGALPRPRRIGHHERWPVEELQAILSGTAARPEEEAFDL